MPQGAEQPADKPEHYPDSILWTLAAAQEDRNVFPATQANLSRPPMDKALRNEDGSMISHNNWEVIRNSAKTAIGIFLRKLNAEESSKKYFRTHHTKEWNQAINFLEIARPLVGMCAGHWKAEHVISTVLTGERTSMNRRGKKAQKKQQHDSEGEDFGKGSDGDNDDDDNDNDNDNNNDGTDFKGKKRSAPRPTTKAKRTKVQREPKPAARVKELPTNTKSNTQQQMKSFATETEAQRPKLKKKAQSKPFDIIYISYLINDTSYIS